MRDSLLKLQNVSTQQGENLLALFQMTFNTAQEAADINTRAARRTLAISARHAACLIEKPADVPLAEIAGELASAWNDYLQSSQSLSRELQEQLRQWVELQGEQMNQAIADNLQSPAPANQEALDIALRSWVALAENSFAQAAKWQQSVEQAQQSGTQALATLTGKPAASKRRTTVAA